MARSREPKRKTSPIHTLLFAWVLVVALSFAPAGAYYYQSGNLVFLLSFATAAFVMGASLMLAMVLARAGTPKTRDVAEEGIGNLHKRGAIFGKR